MLVTELFDSEDPYIDSDAVFGVREDLVGTYQTLKNVELCRRYGVEGDTLLVMEFEFRLSQGQTG